MELSNETSQHNESVRMNAFGNNNGMGTIMSTQNLQSAKCSLMSTANDLTIFVTLSYTDIMDNQIVGTDVNNLIEYMYYSITNCVHVSLTESVE
jgi:hypothetical protein